MSTYSPELPTEAIDRTVYTVNDLNQLAKQILESQLTQLWLEGEISNLARPASGHLYLSLKDSHAQIRAAFFKQAQRSLAIEPRNGQKVLVKGRVSLYTPRGDYQFIITHMELAGDGALRQAYEALKLKLEQEGLFDLKHKRALPRCPQTIGIITSPTGAALRDILHVLARRYPFAQVVIYPAIVQGVQASASLCQALARALDHTAHVQVDVLILGRGGGSIEDLACFNDESLARMIAASPIAVVSAVGHQTDFTIADFVADVRAPTPSAAAELVAPDQSELLMLFSQYTHRFLRITGQILSQRQQRFAALKRLLTTPSRALEQYAQRIDELSKRLSQGTWRQQLATQAKCQALQQRLRTQAPANEFSRHKQTRQFLHNRLQYAMQQVLLQRYNQILVLDAKRAQLDILELITQYKVSCDGLSHRLYLSCAQHFEKSKQSHQDASKRLLGLGPTQTLERGFVLALDNNGQLITRRHQIPHEPFKLRFSDGECQVELVQ